MHYIASMDTGSNTATDHTDFCLSWRIKYRIWNNDHCYQALQDLHRQQPEVFDELVFFGGEYVFHHGYWPLDDLAKRFEKLNKRMLPFREQGVTVSINILSTHGAKCHGHFGEHLPTLPYDGATSADGCMSQKLASPADPRYLAWTAELYRLAAGADPKTLWVDDHLCSSTHARGDFSPASLAGFDAGGWTREQLVAALDDPEQTDLRRQWLDHQDQVLQTYCHTCAEAAREVKPAIHMGLMTVGDGVPHHRDDFYVECIQTMGASHTRPGHGFYRDDAPGEMFRKWLDVMTQCARYPASVSDIHYEFEDWPSNPLFKSIRTVCNEISGAIANGCTGVAMNTLHEFSHDYQPYQDLCQEFARRKHFWKDLVTACRYLPQRGLRPVLAPNYALNAPISGPWTRDSGSTYDATAMWRWLQLGFPMGVDPAGVAILTGQAAMGLSRMDLESLLSKPLLLDEGAVVECWRQGLGKLCGIEPIEYAEACYERFEADGDGRSPVWWGGTPMRPLNDQVQVCSRLQRFDENHDFGASVTCYENERGGRIVHLGLDPWYYIGLPNKLRQFQDLIRWASQDRFPLYLDEPCTLAPVLRQADDDGRFLLLLQNSGLDDLHQAGLRLRSTATALHDLATGETIAYRRDGDWLHIDTGWLPAWSHRVMIGE